MMKRINDDIALILKNITTEKFKDVKYICLDNFYELPSKNYFFEFTIFYDFEFSYLLKTKEEIDGNLININYIPKACIEKKLKRDNDYFFKNFLNSIIVKDNNRFLVNLKAAITFYVEKHQTIINKNEIDLLRWNISNNIDSIKYHDSKYLRYKIFDQLIELYNYFFGSDYISLSSIPFLYLNPANHRYISELMQCLDLSKNDFQNEMIKKINSFGGVLKTIDSKRSFYENEIIIVFKYQNLDLNSFLENIFLKFFSITKKINHKVQRFYWEKNIDGNFILYLNAEKEIIENEILPELRIKLNSNIYLKQISDICTVYDIFQEHNFASLNKLAEYILYLKTDEYLLWNENITLSYSVELYLSCFIKLGFSKSDFFEFNKYFSQKLQLLLISDEELLSNEYTSITEIYQKFEKLYVVNEATLVQNFGLKIDNWIIDDSFSEEIDVLNQDLIIFTSKEENIAISNVILNHFSDNIKYAFIEGFLFKAFGLMGLDTESKFYITYIINRLSNES